MLRSVKRNICVKAIESITLGFIPSCCADRQIIRHDKLLSHFTKFHGVLIIVMAAVAEKAKKIQEYAP